MVEKRAKMNNKCTNCGGELKIVGNYYVCDACGNKVPLNEQELMDRHREKTFHSDYYSVCKRKVYQLSKPINHIRDAALNNENEPFRERAQRKLDELQQKYYQSVERAIITTPGDDKTKTETRQLLIEEMDIFQMEYNSQLDKESSYQIERLVEQKNNANRIKEEMLPKEPVKDPSDKIQKTLIFAGSVFGVCCFGCCFFYEIWTVNLLGNLFALATFILPILSLLPLIGLMKQNKEYKNYRVTMEQVHKIENDIQAIDQNIGRLLY